MQLDGIGAYPWVKCAATKKPTTVPNIGPERGQNILFKVSIIKQPFVSLVHTRNPMLFGNINIKMSFLHSMGAYPSVVQEAYEHTCLIVQMRPEVHETS